MTSFFRSLRHRWILTTLLVLISVLGWTAYQNTSSSLEETPARHTQIFSVWTVKATSLRNTFEAPAILSAQESANVTASVTAHVKKVSFQEGEVVNKEDVLVELTHGDQSGSLIQALALQKERLSSYEKIKALFERGGTPRARVDEAKSLLEDAQIQVQALREKLKDRLIFAPFTGVLGIRHVSEGALVKPGTLITTLDDLSVMRVKFFLPEKVLSHVSPGQKIFVSLDDFPGKRFEATLDLIGSRISPTTKTIELRAHLDNPEGMLRSGMSAHVALEGKPHQGFLVPESAVLPFASDHYVFVLSKKGHVDKRSVQASLHEKGWMKISSGLKEGEVLIKEGVAFLQDQQIVQTDKGRAL